MDFLHAVQSAFQRYFDFTGRSSRSEFWYFILFGFLVGSLLSFLDSVMFFSSELPEAGPLPLHRFYGPLTILFMAGMVIPWLSVSTRRLHDIGRDGWWILFGFVPPIGWLFMMVWLTRDSAPEDNEYGHDPLAGQGLEGHA